MKSIKRFAVPVFIVVAFLSACVEVLPTPETDIEDRVVQAVFATLTAVAAEETANPTPRIVSVGATKDKVAAGERTPFQVKVRGSCPFFLVSGGGFTF